MRDNIDRLFEAVEHPERFTDQELANLLADPDMQALYDTMRKTSDLLSETGTPDLDKEWKRFATRYGLPVRRNIVKIIPYVFTRHAAAVVIAVAVSLAVVAATIGISYTIDRNADRQNTPLDVETVSLTDPVSEARPDTLLTPDIPHYDTVIFRNESLDRIVSVICDYYGASSEFSSVAAKDLHLYFKWDQSLPLAEVVDQLNSFEQINIEVNDSILIID